jgi:hypothetical protein
MHKGDPIYSFFLLSVDFACDASTDHSMLHLAENSLAFFIIMAFPTLIKPLQYVLSAFDVG